MQTFLQDLRYAARTLGKAPAFTAVAVLTLALGIGANTALFSIVDAVLLRPLPYESADRLVQIALQDRGREMRPTRLSIPEFELWRQATHGFDAMSAGRGEVVVVTGGPEPEQIRGRVVTPEFFHMLGAKPLHGRLLGNTDVEDASSPAAVLSYNLWQRRFSGTATAVGDSITLNGNAFTIVGILPPSFRDPNDLGALDWTQVWMPSARPW